MKMLKIQISKRKNKYKIAHLIFNLILESKLVT